MESYPEDADGRSVGGSFLHNGTVSMFESHGFERTRRIGKYHWVVAKAVDPGDGGLGVVTGPRADHPEGSEPFDVTLPEGFDLGEHRSALEAAAKEAGWTVEPRSARSSLSGTSGPRTSDHAAWLVATKVGPAGGTG